MRNLLYRSFAPLGPQVRAIFLRPWYEYISSLDREGEVRFMNYGFQPPGDKQVLVLEPADERDRLCIQLYDHLVGSSNLQGKSVLEVGSGRGGGANYIARYLAPTQITGVDITRRAVQFCLLAYSLDNLDFRQADAEDLPFPDSSFDLVINLESSHCYPNISRFFCEVHRVLGSEGRFAFADWRATPAVAQVRELLLQSGFAILEYEELNNGILSAIDDDEQRKNRLIRKYSPTLLRPVFEEFAGVKRSRAFYQAFKQNERTYFRFLLKKDNSSA